MYKCVWAIACKTEEALHPLGARDSHHTFIQVLVIGGGDGGVLREIIKHPSVESVTLVEIDEAVIRVSKQFLPSMAVGFESPKVQVHIGDGFEYLKAHESAFDVIITDSSDPVGPAESLFGHAYYALLSKALKPNGIVCCQGTLPLYCIMPRCKIHTHLHCIHTHNRNDYWFHAPR